MKKLISLCLYLAVACFLPYNPASADLITSPTDPALSGIPGINFDDQALGQYESLTIGNVTFTPSLSTVAQNSILVPYYYYGAYLYISNTYTGGYPYYTSGRYLNNGGYNEETPGCDIITISFATPTSAFGFSWGAADEDWTLTAYDSSDSLLETHILLPYSSAESSSFYGIAHSGIKNSFWYRITPITP